MKRFVSLVLSVCILFNSIGLGALAASTESVDSKADLEGIRVIDQYGNKVKEELTFKVSEGYLLKELAEIKLVDGILPTDKVPIGELLNLQLKDGGHYSLSDEYSLLKLTSKTSHDNQGDEVDYIELCNSKLVKVEVLSGDSKLEDPLKFELQEGQAKKEIESKDLNMENYEELDEHIEETEKVKLESRKIDLDENIDDLGA